MPTWPRSRNEEEKEWNGCRVQLPHSHRKLLAFVAVPFSFDQRTTTTYSMVVRMASKERRQMGGQLLNDDISLQSA